MSNDLPNLSDPMRSSALIENLGDMVGAGARVLHSQQITLHKGIQLMYWKAELPELLDLRILDDTGFIHFAYLFRGMTAVELCGQQGRMVDSRVSPGSGNIGFAPGERWHFRYQGLYESLGVMISPEALESLDGLIEPQFGRAPTLETGLHGRELHEAASMIVRALLPGEAPARHPLWTYSAGLNLASLLLEARQRQEPARAPGDEDLVRLARARDQLLSDLSSPPLLSTLAKDNGISLLKLKRGFREVYGRAVYETFQHERMLKALQLLHSKMNVTEVASELGYTNASHFSAAFRKEFGLNPRDLKKQPVR